MYRCIVVPVDGSAFGEHAIPYAAAIARRTRALLHLAHVHVPLIAPSGVETVAFRGSWNDLTKEQERTYLDGLVQRVTRAYDVRADAVLMDGPVAPVLEEYARNCDADLVVLSTHGHSRFSRLWHHGVAEHVARELPVPVLMVRPQNEEAETDFSQTPEMRHILIPLDGSPYAEAMVEHAVKLGRACRARYTLLRVIRPEVAVGYTLLGQDGHINHHQLARVKTSALQYLNALAERMRAGGLEVHTHVMVSQEPANAIVGYVRAVAQRGEGPVDLIALETHPHSSVSRILGHHTADLVLRDSPVPVLLLEPPVAIAPRAEPLPTAVAQA